MNVYIDQVDDGLGSADAWDTILAPGILAPGGRTVAPQAPNESRGRQKTRRLRGFREWPGQDSNLRATDYESAALTN